MAKPNSVDLRERVLIRIRVGESAGFAAEALSVGLPSVVKWPQRFRATGSLGPGQMRGHRPRLNAGEHGASIHERVPAGEP